MANRRGRNKPGAHELPQGNGDEGALVRGRDEVAPPQPPPPGPVAAVTKRVCSFFAWRRNVRVEVAAELPRVEVPEHDRVQNQASHHKQQQEKKRQLQQEKKRQQQEKKRQQQQEKKRHQQENRVQNQAWHHKQQQEKKRQQQQQKKEQQQQQKEKQSKSSNEKRYMVEGLEVPMGQLSDYREYCRKSASQPETVMYCHMCHFHWKLTDNGIFPANKEMIHYRSHNDEGPMQSCPMETCRVRVGDSPRELQLHRHFCHMKPAGWWTKTLSRIIDERVAEQAKENNCQISIS